MSLVMRSELGYFWKEADEKSRAGFCSGGYSGARMSILFLL